MSRSPDSTLPAQRIPTVVVIAPSAELVAAVERAVRDLEETPMVRVADVATAATVVAEWRPFAVIVPEPVYAFDSQEFESLARTVGAEIVLVGADPPAAELPARHVARLKETLSWWQSRRAVSP